MAVPAPVSPSFCVPHETQFAVRRKSIWRWAPFSITDEQDRLVFEVESWKPVRIWKAKRRIKDSSGKVVVTIKVELGVFVNTWKAFYGDNESQLLFTVENPVLPWFDHAVFLPGNSDTSRPDFTVRRAAFGNYFTVMFNGMPIAEVTIDRELTSSSRNFSFVECLLAFFASTL